MRLEKSKIASPTEYPFTIPAIRQLDHLKFHPKITFFIGENGMGKSTLIEAIAVKWGFNAEGGSKNFNFATKATHSNLSSAIVLEKGSNAKDGFFLRAESFYNVVSQIDELQVGMSYGDASLHAMSHGESFMALLKNRFRGNGLYILDEPEAALSPQRQLAVLALFHELIESGSQFIIATHSPILMAYPGAMIYELGETGISPVNYEETEHYQITRDFLNHREQMLKNLFQS